MMSKKDFIALADVIIKANTERIRPDQSQYFSQQQIGMLADFCYSQNRNFERDRWLGYIDGTNGPGGGTR